MHSHENIKIHCRFTDTLIQSDLGSTEVQLLNTQNILNLLNSEILYQNERFNLPSTQFRKIEPIEKESDKNS